MTGWLLDTNVVSEISKPNGNRQVKQWVDGLDRQLTFTSVFAIAEIRSGIARLADPARRAVLEAWLLTTIPLWFGDRILGVDQQTAQIWVEVNDAGKAVNHTFPQPDLIIAATAARHGLTVATRNVRDFRSMNVAIFNPWDGMTLAPSPPSPDSR